MFNRTPLAVFAILGSLLGASVAAGAQTAAFSPAPVASGGAAANGTHQHHHGGRMGRALQGLNLTSDQRARIKTLMTSYRASRTSVTPQTRQQLVAGINDVLTPAQRTQFSAAMAHRRRDGSTAAAPTPSP